MIDAALWFCFSCYGLALILNLVQVLRTTGTGDRILALDTMMVNAIALMILYGVARGTPVSFLPALMLAILGFVSTVAYVKYLLRGSIIDIRAGS